MKLNSLVAIFLSLFIINSAQAQLSCTSLLGSSMQQRSRLTPQSFEVLLQEVIVKKRSLSESALIELDHEMTLYFKTNKSLKSGSLGASIRVFAHEGRKFSPELQTAWENYFIRLSQENAIQFATLLTIADGIKWMNLKPSADLLRAMEQVINIGLAEGPEAQLAKFNEKHIEKYRLSASKLLVIFYQSRHDFSLEAGAYQDLKAITLEPKEGSYLRANYDRAVSWYERHNEQDYDFEDFDGLNDY